MNKELNYFLMQNILEELSESDIFETFARNGTLVDFISKLWPIWEMPSSDARFRTKAEDIEQHYVRNFDYSWKHLFISDLKLLTIKNNYPLFLEYLTCIELYSDEKEFKEKMQVFEDILSNHNFYLEEKSIREKNRPLFRIVVNTKTNLANLSQNTYQIIYCEKLYKLDLKKLNFPCFILEGDSWNDFGIYSLFRLYYYNDPNAIKEIGRVKILYIDKNNKISSSTSTNLPEERFYSLDPEFVSLGQDVSYYETIKKCLGIEECKALLLALNDCALFPNNLERIVHFPEYLTSLIREDSAAQAVHLARLVFIGRNRRDFYKISVEYKAPYSVESTQINFCFNPESLFPKRVYCLIGKNGTGKTQLLNQIPDLIKEKCPISPFTNYLFISTCYSESFSRPKSMDLTTIYESCGLLEFKENKLSIKSLDSLKNEIKENIQKLIIEAKGNRQDFGQVDRVQSLKSVLGILFTPDAIKKLFTENQLLNDKEINKLCEHLSSGEFTLLYVITYILSKIRTGSLLLFDEPETHLHPNAVSQMMNAVYELLEQFNSYAIIATHSPLVIREVQSDCLRVIHKIENQCVVRKISQESLGGDLAELTREVFGTDEDQLFYKRKIVQLRKNNVSAEQIRKEIKSVGIPLGIGLNFYISNCVTNEKNNPK